MCVDPSVRVDIGTFLVRHGREIAQVNVTDPVVAVDAPPLAPRTLRQEVLLVFALSLGASAVYSVVSLI
jgi:hypothetical protein